MLIMFNKSALKVFATLTLVNLLFISRILANNNYNNNDNNNSNNDSGIYNFSVYEKSENDTKDEIKIKSSELPRSLLTESDEYVARNQKRCLETRSLVPCIKYKASKIVWRLATNGHHYFPNENGRNLGDDKRRLRLVQLAEASDTILFQDARSAEGDNEMIQIIKFVKRAVEAFGRNIGLQLSISSDSGARISSGEVESRGRHKKHKKWLIILPLVILMKIAHLKMTVVTLLLGVLGLNVLLVGGTGWLIHYLKFKTLCKIHPHLVQSHSHVYDSDPAEYSSFVGSSFPGSYYSSSGGSPHEVNVHGYAKEWGAHSKAYNGHNYLDTISKRLQ